MNLKILIYIFVILLFSTVRGKKSSSLSAPLHKIVDITDVYLDTSNNNSSKNVTSAQFSHNKEEVATIADRNGISKSDSIVRSNKTIKVDIGNSTGNSNSTGVKNGTNIVNRNKTVIGEGIRNSNGIKNSNNILLKDEFANSNGSMIKIHNGIVNSNGSASVNNGISNSNRNVTGDFSGNKDGKSNNNGIVNSTGNSINNGIVNGNGAVLATLANNYVEHVTSSLTTNRETLSFTLNYDATTQLVAHENKKEDELGPSKLERQATTAVPTDIKKESVMKAVSHRVKAVTQSISNPDIEDGDWLFDSNQGQSGKTLSPSTNEIESSAVSVKVEADRRQYVPPGPGPPSQASVWSRITNLTPDRTTPMTIPTNIYIEVIKNVQDFEAHAGAAESFYEPYLHENGHWVYNRTTKFYTTGPSKMYSVLPWGWQMTGYRLPNPNAPFIPTGNYMNYNRECNIDCLIIYRNYYQVVCALRQNTRTWWYERKTFNNMCELEYENCRDQDKRPGWRVAFRGRCEITLHQWHYNDLPNIINRKRKWLAQTFPTRETTSLR